MQLILSTIKAATASLFTVAVAFLCFIVVPYYVYCGTIHFGFPSLIAIIAGAGSIVLSTFAFAVTWDYLIQEHQQ